MMNLKNLDTAIADMMVAIRKNTQGSPCIDTFENLLKEIDDKNHVATVVSEMNRLIEHCMGLFKQIDKLDNTNIKAKMLTYDFIEPERFFRNTNISTINYVHANRALNETMFKNNPEKGAQILDTNKPNMLSSVYCYFPYNGTKPDYSACFNKCKINFSSPEEIHNSQENMRRIILLWNYCPSIVKAIIQTKRRSLGLDSNSKKFK